MCLQYLLSLLVLYFVPQKCKSPFWVLHQEILSLSETNYVPMSIPHLLLKEKKTLFNETNSNVFIERPFNLSKYSDY